MFLVLVESLARILSVSLQYGRETGSNALGARDDVSQGHQRLAEINTGEAVPGFPYRDSDISRRMRLGTTSALKRVDVLREVPRTSMPAPT